MNMKSNLEEVTSIHSAGSGGGKDAVVVPNILMFGQRFQKPSRGSCLPPRRPARRRSSTSHSESETINSSNHVLGRRMAGLSLEKVTNPFAKNKKENRQLFGALRTTSSSTTTATVTATASTTTTLDPNAPCSSVYCDDDENTISGGKVNTRSVLTEDLIRAFLKDYYDDFDDLKGPQTYDVWLCFVEKYYREDFQYIRPSGNPLDREGFAKLCSLDMKIQKFLMISIDSITIFAQGRSAVVLYTCEHYFEFKGIPAEDRAVMTCVLELHPTTGEIRIVHEHRSSAIPIPVESRWNPK